MNLSLLTQFLSVFLFFCRWHLIFALQLKSDLKVSMEENIRLKREIQQLRSLKSNNSSGNSLTKMGKQTPPTSNNSSNNSSISEEQRQKFREAMRALKKVTVSQEMALKKLRIKAQERRKELKQKDAHIDQLERRVTTLEKSGKMLFESSGCSPDEDNGLLHRKVEELHLAYDEAIRRKNDLEEMLDEKDTQLQAMQKQRNNLLAPFHKRSGSAASGDHSDGGGSVGSGSHKSVGSVSVNTALDFDVARLKTELAQKSNKVVKLEMDLEMMRDEMEQMKKNLKRKQSDNPLGSGHGGAASFFPPTNNFLMEQHPQDDWTEADDTDYESEFGESFFANKNDDSVNFW